MQLVFDTTLKCKIEILCTPSKNKLQINFVVLVELHVSDRRRRQCSLLSGGHYCSMIDSLTFSMSPLPKENILPLWGWTMTLFELKTTV